MSLMFTSIPSAAPTPSNARTTILLAMAAPPARVAGRLVGPARVIGHQPSRVRAPRFARHASGSIATSHSVAPAARNLSSTSSEQQCTRNRARREGPAVETAGPSRARARKTTRARADARRRLPGTDHATAVGSGARRQRARGAEPMEAATPIVIVDDDATIAEVIREACEELTGLRGRHGGRRRPGAGCHRRRRPGAGDPRRRPARPGRLRRLRPAAPAAATAGLPVLFMSAVTHAAEFARRGVRADLRQPFDLDDLLARARSLLGRRVAGGPAPPAAAPAAWPPYTKPEGG